MAKAFNIGYIIYGPSILPLIQN